MCLGGVSWGSGNSSEILTSSRKTDYFSLAVQIYRTNGNRAGQSSYSVIGNLYIGFSKVDLENKGTY